MNKSVKGALLSGLVFPGMGQVALGRRGRGFSIIAVVLAGLVVIIARVTQHAQAIVDQMRTQGGSPSLAAITAAVNQSITTSENLMLNLLLGGVGIVWIFSVIDAWRIGKISGNAEQNGISVRQFFEFQYDRLNAFIQRFKELNGNPHYIALGMAVGIFVSFTPTIPIQTVIAVPIAFILRGSKSAAAIGVWLSNPVTLPFFYYVEFKMGCLLLGRSISFKARYESVTLILKLGWDVTLVMMVGGVFLGIIAAVITYFVTRRLAVAVHMKRQAARGL